MEPEVTEEAAAAAVVEDESDDAGMDASLIIPIRSSSSTAKEEQAQFIEIFPEEIPDTNAQELLPILKDEGVDCSVWADAALRYIQHKKHAAQEAAQLLEACCEQLASGALPAAKDEEVRIFAAAGIAHLTQVGDIPGTQTEVNRKEDLITKADQRFTQSSKVNNLYPMTWMGRGMRDLEANRLEQAKFFFDTTLKECGRVLPALLGLAAVQYLEKHYQEAQTLYGEAMKLYPSRSGASTRVGFGLACYKLGQVDRAKAAFARALDMDGENVEAMVGAAVLDMMNLDETSSDFNSHMEKAIKMMSMANLLDHSNAMVQNHLANHYFWKWTPLAGTVQVTQGSHKVKGSQPIPLDGGDRVRIGMDFETLVVDEDDEEDENDDEGLTFSMKQAWKGETTTGLKVWKKDYDRVVALAKGAYNSTSVDEIKAESLFVLGRVYHVRNMMTDARKVYEKSCELNPTLEPARFGLAQVLMHMGEYGPAMAHLQLVLGTSTHATDALATLGLLEVKSAVKSSSSSSSPQKLANGLGHLRKAIDLDPLNHALILLEALALQQHESNYSKALERYTKAAQLMEQQGVPIPFEMHTNIGVLSHQTRKFDESSKAYVRALDALDRDGTKRTARLDQTGHEGGKIRHADNHMFFDYLDASLKVENPAQETELAEGIQTLKLVDSGDMEISALPVKVGDHIRLGDSFQTVIGSIEKAETGGLVLTIEDAYKGEAPKPPAENDENQPAASESMTPQAIAHVPIFVKRENSRLEDPHAISIAFNLARLHETSGRNLAAVELHKAILKRNPCYVNSYLRLACIAIDCGALNECAGWLKLAAEIAPGNAEVLTLIGNLHLSLCDWQPAQQIFDGLLGKKIPDVEAYALLSMGNIYFANLDIPKKYAKHLGYAGDYYKRILTKDNANAYAANGLGTVVAEKGELFKAKEIFNRVREVTGDTISDAHLNLAHIYLAQKKHPEALQMYQSYLKRTEDGSTPITSKSRLDDKVDVLHYIAFAYFDWARQTELFNNAKAAPADERYKKAMEHIELALIDNTSESKNGLLTYNLCMTKLQAANCVLQKLTRNIRRTAQEVEEALKGLQHSLETVETILKNKTEGAKVLISTSILNDFITHCKSNIESAKSHLEDERKREEEAHEIRELQRMAAESKREELKLQKELKLQEEAKRQEELDRRAREKMRKVEDLRTGWEQEQAAAKAAAEKRSKAAPPKPDFIDDSNQLEEEDAPAANTAGLFDDSSDDEEEADKKGDDKVDEETKKIAATTTQEDLFGDSSDDESKDGGDDKPKTKETEAKTDLFGDSSDGESDEELKPSSKKRAKDGDGDEPSAKKMRTGDLEDSE